MKDDLYVVHEFHKEHILTVKVLRAEFIVMLKAVTERDRDFEDILTIVKKTKESIGNRPPPVRDRWHKKG